MFDVTPPAAINSHTKQKTTGNTAPYTILCKSKAPFPPINNAVLYSRVLIIYRPVIADGETFDCAPSQTVPAIAAAEAANGRY